jgi:RNA ligase (TIGR02306 family)
MRKLASIRKIHKISPIANSDNLELAHIDGWQVVVKKNEFNVGSLGVYFEIDSSIKPEPKFQFLEKSCLRMHENGEKVLRIKTIKLRGALSQGLLMPLSDFQLSDDQKVEGSDLTELLGVIVFEAPMSGSFNAGLAEGRFPQFIVKTDQERLQNLTNYFKEYAVDGFEVTEKLDGTSTTIYYNEGKFGICSRNLDLKDGDNDYWNIARKYILDKTLPLLNRNLAIQGEMIGIGIQGNKYKLTDKQFYVFDIYDIDTRRHLTPQERMELMASHFIDLKHVPIIADVYAILHCRPNIDSILEYAEGSSALNPNQTREGIVCKSCFGSVSFKVISNKFLLKEKE